MKEVIKFHYESCERDLAPFPAFEELNACRQELRRLGLLGVDESGVGFGNIKSIEGPALGGIVRDITERREIERLKREFVSTVSHELRTPLTSIRGSLGLLSSGALGTLAEEARDLVNVAERNVIRLITLINDILDLGRLESGRLEMRLTPFRPRPS